MYTALEKEVFMLLIGKQIDTLRKERGYSYMKLAKKSGLDSSDISKITKGRVNITLSTLLQLSKGLGVHPKRLFDFKLEP